jgi:hypothetical protein
VWHEVFHVVTSAPGVTARSSDSVGRRRPSRDCRITLGQLLMFRAGVFFAYLGGVMLMGVPIFALLRFMPAAVYDLIERSCSAVDCRRHESSQMCATSRTPLPASPTTVFAGLSRASRREPRVRLHHRSDQMSSASASMASSNGSPRPTLTTTAPEGSEPPSSTPNSKASSEPHARSR